jgi:hypothetical protein
MSEHLIPSVPHSLDLVAREDILDEQLAQIRRYLEAVGHCRRPPDRGHHRKVVDKLLTRYRYRCLTMVQRRLTRRQTRTHSESSQSGEKM